MAGRRRSDRALRDKLRPPGRPGMARREDRLRFWALIAAGLSSEDAAIGAGVSPPVGTRWFREAGGMPSSTFASSSKPLSGRYLAFAEREEIALVDGHGPGARVKNGPALAGHGAGAVRDAITRTITTLPEQLRRSLTWDQGAELSQHAQLRIETGVQIYFCDPHSPWQRGTNDNTNGLLR